MPEHFYITTTLPYVNAEPHIGFALEIIAADVIARYQKNILSKTVVFNTGTDEHGQKIYQKAEEVGENPQSYVDRFAKEFSTLKSQLNLSFTHFIRTTDTHHKAAAQAFWLRCQKTGDIYKKMYKIHYCVGCELEKQASELVDEKCPLHPNKELEIREEENYFFSFSNYQQPLLKYYSAHPEFVKPESKMKEISAFVSGGLQDFSISRLKEKMPWVFPSLEMKSMSCMSGLTHLLTIFRLSVGQMIKHLLTLFGLEFKLLVKIIFASKQQCGKQCYSQQNSHQAKTF